MCANDPVNAVDPLGLAEKLDGPYRVGNRLYVHVYDQGGCFLGLGGKSEWLGTVVLDAGTGDITGGRGHLDKLTGVNQYRIRKLGSDVVWEGAEEAVRDFSNTALALKAPQQALEAAGDAYKGEVYGTAAGTLLGGAMQLRRAAQAIDGVASLVDDGERGVRLARRSPGNLWDEPADVLGRRVYRRGDLFEPNTVNLARMRKGRPPIGYDNQPVVLHHLTQDEPGAMAEAAGGFHSTNTKVIHGLTESKGSFRYSPGGPTTEAEKAFRRWEYAYWQDRAGGLGE